jgi:hypothetical protein
MNHWGNLDAAKFDTAQLAEMKKASTPLSFRAEDAPAARKFEITSAHELQPLCQPTDLVTELDQCRARPARSHTHYGRVRKIGRPSLWSYLGR